MLSGRALLEQRPAYLRVSEIWNDSAHPVQFRSADATFRCVHPLGTVERRPFKKEISMKECHGCGAETELSSHGGVPLCPACAFAEKTKNPESSAPPAPEDKVPSTNT
jgi:hypothetical protein